MYWMFFDDRKVLNCVGAELHSLALCWCTRAACAELLLMRWFFGLQLRRRSRRGQLQRLNWLWLTPLCYRQCETLLSHGEEEFKLNAGEIINRKCVHKCNAWEHEPIKFWPVRQTLSALTSQCQCQSNPIHLNCSNVLLHNPRTTAVWTFLFPGTLSRFPANEFDISRSAAAARGGLGSAPKNWTLTIPETLWHWLARTSAEHSWWLCWYWH